MIKFIFSFPRWLRVILGLLYLAIIAKLSLMPPDEIPDMQLFPGFDKLVHGSMYFGLTFLACWTFQAEERKIRIFWVVLFAFFWGFFMEISQMAMHAGRAFEWKDEAANALGALLGAGLYAWVAIGHRKSRRRG